MQINSTNQNYESAIIVNIGAFQGKKCSVLDSDKDSSLLSWCVSYVDKENVYIKTFGRGRIREDGLLYT